MSDVNVAIGSGSIGQAVARRVSVGKHVVLADAEVGEPSRAPSV
jgi:predicted dinucleotide-binding enzyme